jgi:glycosyltransferase involved in cell wall biosynthesis
VKPSIAFLHICFVSQEYPPETGWGGIGAYTYEMACGLAAAGHRVTVISLAVGAETTREIAGVTVHRVLPAPQFDSMRALWRLNRYWPGFAWAAMLRFRKLHADQKVDLVEAAEGRADGFFITLLRNRPPVVARLHTARIFVDRLNGIRADRKERFMYWLERRAILGADMVTAPSRAVVDLTRAWLPHDRRQVAVVPNPVDTCAFAPNDEPRRLEVLIVGRLERRKLGDLPEAMPSVMERCPEAVFRFVGGDGPDESGHSWRERLMEGLPPEQRNRLVFEQVPRDQLAQRYRQAAVVVMASRWENFPYALLEAMACGTPAVATRTGGLPQIVSDGVNGVVVPPEAAGALAEAICMLLERPDVRRQMGVSARQAVEERFSLEAIIPKMLEVYKSAAGFS